MRQFHSTPNLKAVKLQEFILRFISTKLLIDIMNVITITLTIVFAYLISGAIIDASAQLIGPDGVTPCSASYPCNNVCGGHICKPGEAYVPSRPISQVNEVDIQSQNQQASSTPPSSLNMVLSSKGSGNIAAEFSFLGQPIINDNGDIIFPASPDGQSTYIFKLSNGFLTKIVSSGDIAPKPIGGVLDSVGLPSSNGNKTIFYGTISGGSADEAIFESANNSIVKIVAKGDRIPDGGFFDDFGFPPQAINKNGDIFFYSSIRSNINDSLVINDIDPAIKTGIFMYSNGTISKIISKFDPSPLGGNFTSLQYGVRPINNARDIVFSSTLLDSPAFQGIFKYSNGKITPIISTLDHTTNGLKFSRFESPSINDRGDIVFFGGNTQTPSSKGIYEISSGHLSKILSVGDPTPTGGFFYHMDAISISNNGDILFLGFIKDGTSSYGIFKISGNKIFGVSTGQTSPSGSVFSSIFAPIMNENGKTVFSANMKNKDLHQGIFVIDSNSVKVGAG